MNSVRFIFIIFMVVLTLGMLNYTIFDKLNYIYLLVVLSSVFLVFRYAEKLCLSYFKSREITSVEDPLLTNYIKSLSYSKSTKEPKVYIYEGSYKSCFLFASIFGWSLLIEKSLLLNLSKEQKYELISGVLEMKKKNPNSLKTFGLSLQVITLKILDIVKSNVLKTALLFFLNPINKFVEYLTNPKLKGSLDKSLQEFYLRNLEVQRGFQTLENILQRTPSKIEFQTYNILQNGSVSYE